MLFQWMKQLWGFDLYTFSVSIRVILFIFLIFFYQTTSKRQISNDFLPVYHNLTKDIKRTEYSMKIRLTQVRKVLKYHKNI